MFNKSFIKFAFGFFALLAMSFIFIIIADRVGNQNDTTQEAVIGS